METQWQRALEMISTGSHDDSVENRHQSAKKCHNQRDTVGFGKGNEVYETPVSNRMNKKFEDDQDAGDDKLQSFIDLVNFLFFRNFVFRFLFLCLV